MLGSGDSSAVIFSANAGGSRAVRRQVNANGQVVVYDPEVGILDAASGLGILGQCT